MPAVTNYFTAKRLFSFVVLSPGYFLDIYRNMAVTGEWLPPCRGLFHNKIYTAVKVLKPRLINHRFLTGKHLHTSNHSRRFYRVLGVCDLCEWFCETLLTSTHCLYVGHLAVVSGNRRNTFPVELSDWFAWICSMWHQEMLKISHCLILCHVLSQNIDLFR